MKECNDEKSKVLNTDDFYKFKNNATYNLPTRNMLGSTKVNHLELQETKTVTEQHEQYSTRQKTTTSTTGQRQNTTFQYITASYDLLRRVKTQAPAIG